MSVTISTHAQLRLLRKRLGLGQRDMGFLLGVNKQTVCEWEKERRSPNEWRRDLIDYLYRAPNTGKVTNLYLQGRMAVLASLMRGNADGDK